MSSPGWSILAAPGWPLVASSGGEPDRSGRLRIEGDDLVVEGMPGQRDRWRVHRSELAAVVPVRSAREHRQSVADVGEIRPGWVLRRAPIVPTVGARQSPRGYVALVFSRPLAPPEPATRWHWPRWLSGLPRGRRRGGSPPVDALAVSLSDALPAQVVRELGAWGAPVAPLLPAALGATIGVIDTPSVVDDQISRRRRRRWRRRGLAVAAAVVVYSGAVTLARSLPQASPSCTEWRPASGVVAPPALSGGLARSTSLDPEGFAMAVFGTQDRVARLAELGPSSLRSETWHIEGHEVEVRIARFADGSDAAAYARLDLELICRFERARFEPPGVVGGVGVAQQWQAGPDGYYVATIVGSTFARAYARHPEPDVGPVITADALRHAAAGFGAP